jgi:hypothetical protein
VQLSATADRTLPVPSAPPSPSPSDATIKSSQHPPGVLRATRSEVRRVPLEPPGSGIPRDKPPTPPPATKPSAPKYIPDDI